MYYNSQNGIRKKCKYCITNSNFNSEKMQILYYKTQGFCDGYDQYWDRGIYSFMMLSSG